MKRRFAAVLAAVLLLSGCGAQTETSEQFIAMDTTVALRFSGKQGAAAASAAEKQIYELEELLSRTRSDSEVSRINRAGGQPHSASEEVCALLEAALFYTEVTGGAFDVTVAPVVSAWGFTEAEHTVPPQEELTALLQNVGAEHVRISQDTVTLSPAAQIDLGGIAKGYATDLIHALCDTYQVESGTVSLGGNIYVRGTKADGTLWQVGVQDPAGSGLAGIVGLSDAYAVTSGGYQRYFEQDGKIWHHIIDPADGYPAESGLASVTVVAPAAAEDGKDGQPGNGTMCDALSTALFVMGEEAALDFRRSSGLDFDLILITEDNRVVITDGIADRFTKQEGSGYRYETVS